VLSLLMEKNQQWAKTAWAIGFSAGKKTFTQTGLPNRFALHDTGAATANLATEGTALGLRTHFMGGFDAQRARTEFHVPDDFEVGAAFAIGYIDEAAAVPAARTRRNLEEIVFGPIGVHQLRSKASLSRQNGPRNVRRTPIGPFCPEIVKPS